MRTRSIFLLGSLLLVAALPVYAGKVPKEFKQRLFERYDQKDVICVPGGIPVTVNRSTGLFMDFDSYIRHFHTSAKISKVTEENYQRLDARTFVQVDVPRAGVADWTRPGERFRVAKFYVHSKVIVFYLVSRSPTRFASRYPAQGINSEFGVNFYFYFAPEIIESGDYETVVKEINLYLVPVAEAEEAARAAYRRADAAKRVEIQPGMSKEDVIRALGEPMKIIVFGQKTILKYQDITIELEDNKVTDVKAN